MEHQKHAASQSIQWKIMAVAVNTLLQSCLATLDYMIVESFVCMPVYRR